MAKIGLIDVDGHNYPNLPLMKLSAWHKVQGDVVEWYDSWEGIIEPYDKVYMSKVFSFTPDYDAPVYAKEVHRGGSGYCIELENGKEVYHAERDSQLPYEIEHIYPDYELYGVTDTAYGFLTRGCPRGCSFCHVAAKEGRYSYKVADLDEFWRGQKNIVLCDPNLIACKEWKDLLQQLIDSKAEIDINQGIDIRIMTSEKAEMIKKLKVKNVHFAWDRYEDKDIVVPRFKEFKELTGWSYTKLTVFVLTNYDTTFEQDLERVYLLRDMGYNPYVMIYDKEHTKGTDNVRRLQGWVNNRKLFRSAERLEEVDPLYRSTRKKMLRSAAEMNISLV